MANKNYVAGRRVEYLMKQELEDWGYYVIRSAGSKGAFDLAAFDQTELFNHPVRLIQLKAVKTEAEKNRLLKVWKAPLPPSPHYRQEIIVRWSGRWWGVPPEHRHEHSQAHGHAAHA
jgi:hypothetical protein